MSWPTSWRLAAPGSLVLLIFTVACQGGPAPAATAPAATAVPATAAPRTPAPPSQPTPAAAAGRTPTVARPATARPTTARATVAPTTAATAAAAPAVAVPVGASRADVVNAADRAFQSGNTRAAIELYDRVVNTPPAPGEAPAVTTTVDGYARFRGMLALVAAGREEEARQQLAALRAHDANGPLTRLAGQFWDQYGMTAQPKASCAQLKGQLATAAPALTTLRGAGITVEPDRLCSLPGG